MRLTNFLRLDDDHPFTGKHMTAVVLLWPLALPSGLLWLPLFWSLLLWTYLSASERVVLVALWLLVGAAPLVVTEQRRQVAVGAGDEYFAGITPYRGLPLTTEQEAEYRSCPPASRPITHHARMRMGTRSCASAPPALRRAPPPPAISSMCTATDSSTKQARGWRSACGNRTS